LLAQPASRQRLTESLVRYGTNAHQVGIVADFEDVPEKSQKAFRQLIAELATALHAAGLKLMVALPAADSSYDYKYFASQADAIILMNYDQHWLSSPPGPIAAQDWFVRNLNSTLREVRPEKLVMASATMPTTGRRHRAALRRPAESLSVQEAILRAYESEAQVEFDAIRSIRITTTTMNTITSIACGCWTASPLTTSCACASGPGFVARRCGGWVQPTARYGPSGTSRMRMTLPASASRTCLLART